MHKFNELAASILEAKYYGPADKSPEDVLQRVARVCAIPDAIDFLLGNDPPNAVLINYEALKPVFSEYTELASRVLMRRVDTCMQDDSLHAPFVRREIDAAEVSAKWSVYTTEYYQAMINLEFMPATPTLMNAGVGGMLSSCFAIRVPDSMEGIFDVVKEVAIISQKGGGVGLDVSDLRPEGSPVGVRRGVSSGPISFLKVFNEAGNQVKQGGSRRAALLAGLRVDHPDILKFIRCKETEGELSNFNLSVFITDDFMKAVKNNETVTLHHPCSASRVISAIEIWKEIVNRSWTNGEPGVIFQDRIDKDDITHGKYGKFLVNPCSELTLNSYSSCNLASINISNLLTEDEKFDLAKFSKLVHLGVRFLDNVVDLNNYPLKKIEQITLSLRPVGLGIMGLHDLMLRMGIEYGTQTSLDLIDLIYSTMKNCAERTSADLADRGIPKDLLDAGLHRRNGYLLTAPPTGTISMICNQTSSGIEPVFQWEYTRKDSYGEHKMCHWLVTQLDEEQNGLEFWPSYAKTALEISPEAHVRVQAQIQKYLDESVSKTVNLPNTATKEDVDKIFHMAYDLGCKSITVYRTGSRKDEVLVTATKEQSTLGIPIETERKALLEEKQYRADHPELYGATVEASTDAPRAVRDRPRVLFGATYRYNSSCGKIYITVSEDKYGVREVLVNVSRAGSEINSHVASEGKLVSTLFKHNVAPDIVIGQLKGQKSTPVIDHGRWVLSVPDAIAQAIEEYRRDFEGFSLYVDDPLCTEAQELPVPPAEGTMKLSGEFCAECGNVMVHEGGCQTCKSCGYSKCGG